MACGSASAELLLGKTLKEAELLSTGDLILAVGELPEASAHAAQLALDTVGMLLKAVHV